MKPKTRAVIYPILFTAAMTLVPTAMLWADSEESAAPPSIATVQASYGKLPLSFEANQGQWDPAVQFVTRGGGHTLFLTPSEAVLSLRTGGTKNQERGIDAKPHKTLSSTSPSSYSAVRMRFEGADSQAEMVGLEPLPGIVNYFIGDDPAKWHTNIPTYQKVEYKNLYAGIDLVYYGNQGQLEYDLVVAPGADPTQIMLAFDGAEQVTVDEQGDLVLTLPQQSAKNAEQVALTLRLHKPVVYQRDERGQKHLLAGTYVFSAATDATAVALHPQKTQQVTFQIASYDESKPLIIDPVLSWATYLGGSSGDRGTKIAVGAAGNAYVTGAAGSSDFPGTADSPIQPSPGGIGDVFVTKLNAAGTAIVYSTYLGGFGCDGGEGIAVDTDGNAYVTGTTCAMSGFPGTAGSSIQSTSGNPPNAFVTKLNANGTAIVYSTYLGGNGADFGKGIAVDSTGNAYVTGDTTSPDFPRTTGSSPPTPLVGAAFVTKVNETGTAIVYSTFLSGSNGASSTGIAVDQAGQAYVIGSTNSPDFSGTANSPIQSTHAGLSDAFVTKLNASGSTLVYSTYLGSSSTDDGHGIAVDTEGNAYVIGRTFAPGSSFPGTAGSLIQSIYADGGDAFVTKINPSGTAIVYSTYLGGSGEDVGNGIAVDAAGNAYVTGFSNSSDFPGTADSSIQKTIAGDRDAFITKLNTTGTMILYSTYLGGSDLDHGEGIAVDPARNVYVIGVTNTPGSGLPGTASSPIQNTYRGSGGVSFNAFVAKITSTSTSIINDNVTFEPLASTYRTTTNPTGCPAGFVGTFSFDAELTAKDRRGSSAHSDLAVKVATLSNGNLLQNADGGNGGVGSLLTVPKQSGYADGTLSPGESVNVHFSLCLKANTPFTFFVDVLEMR